MTHLTGQIWSINPAFALINKFFSDLGIILILIGNYFGITVLGKRGKF